MLDHTIFVEAHKRNRRAMGFVVVLCLALSVPAAVAAATSPESRGPAAAVAMAFGVLGLALFAQSFLRDPNQLPVVRVLRDRPRDVVWIYETQQRVRGVHVSTRFTLGLRDGTRVTGGVHRTREEETRATLRRTCGGAAYGYSRELEQRFARDAASLEQPAAQKPAR